MDLPTVTCTSPSRILPSHEVVGPQVPQAGPGCRQLMTIVSSFYYNVESLSRSDRNNDFLLYILPPGLSPIIPCLEFLLFSSCAAKAFLQGSSYFQIFFVSWYLSGTSILLTYELMKFINPLYSGAWHHMICLANPSTHPALNAIEKSFSYGYHWLAKTSQWQSGSSRYTQLGGIWCLGTLQAQFWLGSQTSGGIYVRPKITFLARIAL